MTRGAGFLYDGAMTGFDFAKPQTPARDQPEARTALLIIDMINAFDFEGADKIMSDAVAAASVIADLKAAMLERRLPVIYVNDNFGEWRSDRSKLVESALKGCNDIVELLLPREDDFFVIKPQFSGFYATNLPVLLPKLGVTRLVLTGIATDICVLFTAADAHMRDYALWVPSNAVAAQNAERARWALNIMSETMDAETASTCDLDVRTWENRLTP